MCIKPQKLYIVVSSSVLHQRVSRENRMSPLHVKIDIQNALEDLRAFALPAIAVALLSLPGCESRAVKAQDGGRPVPEAGTTEPKVRYVTDDPERYPQPLIDQAVTVHALLKDMLKNDTYDQAAVLAALQKLQLELLGSKAYAEETDGRGIVSRTLEHCDLVIAFVDGNGSVHPNIKGDLQAFELALDNMKVARKLRSHLEIMIRSPE